MEDQRTSEDDLVGAKFNASWIIDFAESTLNLENITQNAKSVIKRDDLMLWYSSLVQE